MAIKMISWDDLMFWDAEGNEHSDPVTALREYREYGILDGYYFVNPVCESVAWDPDLKRDREPERDADDGLVYDPFIGARVRVWDAGPDPDQIDWEGFLSEAEWAAEGHPLPEPEDVPVYAGARVG